MSSTYLKLYLKNELKNPYLWGWSIGFMIFWLLLGYAAIGSLLSDLQKYGLTQEEIAEAGLCYTAGWYSSVAVIGLGSAAVGLCMGIYFASLSIRYVTKYSKLKASTIFAQSVLGYIVVCLFVSIILLCATIALYSHGFSVPMTPKNPAMLFVTLLVTGVFYYVLSSTLVYGVIVARRPRAAMVVSYLPLVLALGLVLTAMNVSLYNVNIVSPFNAASLLIFHYYTGKDPPITAFKEYENIVTTSPSILWLSLLLWIAALSLTTIVLIKKQRGVSAEEILAF